MSHATVANETPSLNADHAHILLDALSRLRADDLDMLAPWQGYDDAAPGDPKATLAGYVGLLDEATAALGALLSSADAALTITGSVPSA